MKTKDRTPHTGYYIYYYYIILLYKNNIKTQKKEDNEQKSTGQGQFNEPKWTQQRQTKWKMKRRSLKS